MTLADVTAWVHEHVASVVIVAQPDRYTALEVTVTSAGKSATIQGLWDPVVGMSEAIAAWEKLP